jgi:hypothetical protein
LLRLQVTDQSGKMKSTVESIDGGGGENIAIRTPKVTVSHVQRVS